MRGRLPRQREQHVQSLRDRKELHIFKEQKGCQCDWNVGRGWWHHVRWAKRMGSVSCRPQGKYCLYFQRNGKPLKDFRQRGGRIRGDYTDGREGGNMEKQKQENHLGV